MGKNIKGKLLSKAPCNKDLFEGGAHQNLAKVISDEIRHDDKCTIIGIDGGWGTGKSNLVGMIQEELSSGENKGKYHFFTYDAWGHQSDLQRRTILEELTMDLVDGNVPILDENSWKDSLDNLLAKKKQTSTKTMPAIGKGTIVSLFSILLTPFVTHLALLIPIEWLRPLILSIPYLAAYGFFGYRHYGRMKDKYRQNFTWEKCISEFFLIYKDKIKEETKFETISEKEPSSRQFKEWIHEIDEGLKAHNNVVLILVIDNMDRLPKQKVQELWAAIHSCFSEERYTNIRIIVPFDRAHIRNAFQSENIVTSNGECNAVAVYGDDFINKTFYVVYSVPPPILSGWKHYFVDRWKEAFGGEVSVDNQVLQIYDILTKEQSPRKIIAFINQFVTLRNLCDEQIDDKYIALYIFGRSKIVENPFEEILKPSYLGGLNFMYSGDKDMPKCISSLYYQLPLDTAMDVVFTQEITAELNDNKVNVLDQLKGNTNYWDILCHSITNVTNVENAALALEEHFKNDDSPAVIQIWDTLYDKISKGLDSYLQYKEYHYILLKHISDKQNYYEHLIAGYHTNIDETFDLNNYIHGVDKLHEIISENDRCTSVYKSVLTPELYLQLIEMCQEEFIEYGFAVEDDKFDDYLCSFSIDKLAGKSLYPLMKDVVKTPKYITKIKQQLSGNVSNIQIETNLLARLKEIVKDDRPMNISDYLTDYEIYNLLNKLTKDDELYPDALSMAISRFTDGNGDLRGYLLNSVGVLNEEQLELVAKCIQYYICYGDLLLQLEQLASIPYVVEIAKRLTVRSFGISRMNLKKILIHYDSISDYLKLEPNVMLNKWDGWHHYVNEITNEDIPLLPISLIEAMKSNKKLKISEYCLNLVSEYLKTLGQDSWKQSLASENFNMKLLEVYHPFLLPFFVDAFKENMRDYALEGSATKISKGVAKKGIKILLDMGYDVSLIFKEVRDVLIDNSCITIEKLKYFGDFLFEYGHLEDNRQIFNKVIKSEYLGDDVIKKMLVEHKEVIKNILAHDENPSDFKNKMKALAESTYKEDDDFISLCKDLKIVGKKK